jgi:hypothetical protein
MVNPMAIDRDPNRDSGEAGFLSRWSQRKQALKKGVELAEPVVAVETLPTKEFKKNMPVAGVNTAQSAPDLGVNQVSQVDSAKAEELPPAPTMKDVHDLTPQSDFKPFMRADVAPEVKNAAMKQLFKDPHFNVMDMMDIYVDDYSKPDPLPPEMLRKLAVTQFLGFWKEEEEEAAKKAAEEKAAQENASEEARENVQGSGHENVAQSVGAQEIPALTEESQAAAPATAVAQASPTLNDHPDLQLQPDHASGREASLHRAG